MTNPPAAANDPPLAGTLRDAALAIWRAGVAAVDSRRLVLENVRCQGRRLQIGPHEFDLAGIGRIEVLGAGKAGAGMASGLEAALCPELLATGKVSGWLNVPADCVRPLQCLALHAARPAGVNEPRPEGVAGAEEILRRARSLATDDLCIVLLSGGASALLPAPVEAISLDEKLALTRHLSSHGANIRQLNTVRKQLSRIKGGGLLRACGAGRLVALVISDVIGDPLEVIGSGPTIDEHFSPAEALAILERFGVTSSQLAPRAVAYLASNPQPPPPAKCRAEHLIIGNNAVAVDAAGQEAVRLGFSPALVAATGMEGAAEEVGRHLAQMARHMQDTAGPDCLISGGEPVVSLAPPDVRGLGGRNQQLVLAALQELWSAPGDLALVSGGTDGEDGPTDAAGAWLDTELIHHAAAERLLPDDALRRNDAYHYFDQLGALIKTGPTHTNVCDVRVLLVRKQSRST